MLEVWANLDLYTPLSQVAEAARRAERLGYDTLCVPDLVHDGIAAATLAAQATSRIQITWSALIAFPRSPMTVAVAAWDLQAFSNGRFSIGLGPQIRPMIIDRFSTPWAPPAPRMRDYVASLRAIFDCWQNGTPLDYQGEHYRFTRMQAYTSPPPSDHLPIPIRLSGIGANMTALAGEVAEGLNTHPTNACPRYLDEHVRPNVERGAAKVDRAPSDLHLVANPLCATGRDASEVADQRAVQRQLLATLYSTPSYWPTLALYGWQDRGQRLHQMVRDGRWDDLAGVVDDEMLDRLVPAAPHFELAEILSDRYEGRADAVTYPMPADPTDDGEAARGIAQLRGQA